MISQALGLFFDLMQNKYITLGKKLRYTDSCR